MEQLKSMNTCPNLWLTQPSDSFKDWMARAVRTTWQICSVFISVKIGSSSIPSSEIKDLFYFLLLDLSLSKERMNTTGSEKRSEIQRRISEMLILDILMVCDYSAVLERSNSNKQRRFLKSFYRAMVCKTPETIENNMAWLVAKCT